MFWTRSCAVAIAALGSLAQVQAKAVFAHFMVGNVAAYSVDDWADDITKAVDAGIDAFALNISPQDSYTTTQINNAAEAAKSVGNFSLFFSFDYLSGGPWDANAVINTVNSFVNTYGQVHYRYNEKPLVSTFEGVNSAGDWAGIKSATGCFFIPDWTSATPGGIPKDNIDGAFNWDAWPHGPVPKDTSADTQWQQSLGGKPYMMGISPWFYTNLPQWNKNWGLQGDDLWSTRWSQAVDLQPEFVEIISWNDYGESHYIGPIHAAGIPENAGRYVASNPHDAWRNLLPYYISAYKNSGTPANGQEQVTYYHKPNPAAACSDGGTAGNQPGDTPYTIEQVSKDQISIDVLVVQPADVTVQIGANAPTVLRAPNSGLNHFAVPFNGQTGKVTVTVNGQSVVTATGTEISSDCSSGGGLVNWNAIVAGSL